MDFMLEKKINELALQALQKNQEELNTWLDEVCQGDDSLRRSVVERLKAIDKVVKHTRNLLE